MTVPDKDTRPLDPVDVRVSSIILAGVAAAYGREYPLRRAGDWDEPDERYEDGDAA